MRIPNLPLLQANQLSSQSLVAREVTQHSWHQLGVQQHVGLRPYPCTNE